MKAAEWDKSGWQYVVEHWPQVIRNLAAMEAELGELAISEAAFKKAADEANGGWLKQAAKDAAEIVRLEADRDDLRRKLEEIRKHVGPAKDDYSALLAVLRRCVGWMEGQFCPEDTNCANCAAGRFIVDAAREFTEEAGKWK